MKNEPMGGPFDDGMRAPMKLNHTQKIKNLSVNGLPEIFDLDTAEFPEKRYHSIRAIVAKLNSNCNNKFITQRRRKENSNLFLVWRLT